MEGVTRHLFVGAAVQGQTFLSGAGGDFVYAGPGDDRVDGGSGDDFLDRGVVELLDLAEAIGFDPHNLIEELRRLPGE